MENLKTKLVVIFLAILGVGALFYTQQSYAVIHEIKVDEKGHKYLTSYAEGRPESNRSTRLFENATMEYFGFIPSHDPELISKIKVVHEMILLKGESDMNKVKEELGY